MTRPWNNQLEKKNLSNSVSANHRAKLKDNEKNDKYLDLAGELKTLWNMKVSMTPIVIGALGIVTKWLMQELENL